MQRDKDYDETAEETARHQWWEDLRARSLGTCHVREWTYLWIGVVLRRVAAAHPGPGLHHRTVRNRLTLIGRECYSPAWDPEEPHDYREQLWDFLRAEDGPWSIVYDRERDKYSINRVASLDEDIEYARAKQRHRMDQEQRLRAEADRRQGKPVLKFPELRIRRNTQRRHCPLRSRKSIKG